ncbi:MAG TPA: hypothetical protein ENH29_09785 [Bacteroidetes bacterium]|nr:hypothetical protein [Bacteroidota bacterium]
MKKICFLLLLIMLTFLISLPLFAGTTGKIRGVIKDKANGDPLPGVNVVITHVWRFGKAVKLTTPLGAATNLNGEFIILQVPPGIYSVTAKMMGYTNKVQQHVQVFIDRTTTINFTLPSIVLDLGKSVVVEAKRDVVQLDVASTENYISEEDYKETPFANRVEDVIGMQSGVSGNIIEGEIKIREGEAYEVGFLVDGMSMVDNKFNRPVISINPGVVQEIKIIRNGFNAEYGQAQSGLINVITKNPNNKLHFSMDYQFDPPHRPNYGRSWYDPASRWEYRLISDQYKPDSLFLNEGRAGEWKYWRGWKKYAEDLNSDGDPNNDLTPEEANELWKWRHRSVDYGNLAGHNADFSLSGRVPLIPWKANFLAGFKYEFHPFTLAQTRDHYGEKISSLKLVNQITPNLKITLNGMYSKVKTVTQGTSTSSWSEEDRLSYSGGGVDIHYRFRKPILDRSTSIAGLKLVHTLSPKMFYEINLNHFYIDWNIGRGDSSRAEDGRYFHGRLYYDPNSGWISRANGVDDAASGYRMWGAPHTWDDSYNRRTVLQTRFTDQFNEYNELKAGFSFKYETLYENRVHWDHEDPEQEFQRKMNVNPFEIGWFVQDKIEFKGMIANVGVRFDYFNTNTDVWAIHQVLDHDENDQAIWTNDTLYQAVKLGIYPKYRAKPKYYVSPRIGISHPLTDKSKIYFNYGHFVQTPRSAALYEYVLDGRMPRIQWMGNPDIGYEKTIAYELGYDQAIGDYLSIHIGAFYKDYHDVVSGMVYAHFDQSLVMEWAAQRENREIRGLEIELRKSYGKWITGWINYNLTKKSKSDLEIPNLSDIPIITDEPSVGINGELRGVPRQIVSDVVPYGRGVITFRVPARWGPKWKGRSLLGNTSLSTQVFYQRGGQRKHPRSSFRSAHPDVRFREISKYWANIRISRSFNLRTLRLDLYMDASNVVHSKFRYPPGGRNGVDYYDDLYASGRLDQVGTDKLTDPNILNTESDNVYWAKLRTYIFGIRLHL